MAAPPPKDPMMDAMMLAANNPEAAQTIATVGVSAATSAEKAGGGQGMAHGAKVMAGAAAVGGLAVGAVAGSTMLGVAAAGGAAYAATRNDALGDAAKATGKAALSLGNKAVELNNKHHITAQVGAAASKGLATAQAIEQKHNVTSKLAGGITKGMNAITEKLKK